MVLTTPRWVEFVPRRDRDDPNYDPGPLAKVLKHLRGLSGLTQTEVGGLAGFAQGYYSSLETGVIRSPANEKLTALEKVFGIPLGEIDARRKQVIHERHPAKDAASGDEDSEDIRVLYLQLSRERQRELETFARWLADQESG